MSVNSLLLAIPIFWVVYRAVELLLDARAEQKWGVPGSLPSQTGSAQKALREFTSFSGKLGFNKTLLRYKMLRERLDLLLLRAGYPFGWKSEDFLFCKEIVTLLMIFVLWRLEVVQPLLWVAGLILGFWLPDMYMSAKGTTRRAMIQRLLPGLVDLLALALESGLDLLTAVERILEKMKPSPLKDELATLLQENRLGTPRKDALEHMAYRIHLQDVQSLTSIIIQSEELGTGLAVVLRNYADDMRNRRILRAEEIAGKAPTKLLFPMMVFFFPIVFIIIFGPLAINFMSSYK